MSDKRPNHTNLRAEMAAARQDFCKLPTILGGQFTHNRLTAFLRYWRLDEGAMKWRIWELTNAITFGTDIGDTQHLQRAEIFGEEGHLSLRRDGQQWFWHFIGVTSRESSSSRPAEGSKMILSAFISKPTKTAKWIRPRALFAKWFLLAFSNKSTVEPAREDNTEEFSCVDYWTSDEARRESGDMRRYEESVILWGEKKGGDALWWDDRVATAILRYPVVDEGNARVKLEFWRYTQAGRTAFVWYRKLDGRKS